MQDKKQRMTHSLVMALAVCYHARLTVREDYETKVCAQFKPSLNLQGGTEQFRSEITRYMLIYTPYFYAFYNFYAFDDISFKKEYIRNTGMSGRELLKL